MNDSWLADRLKVLDTYITHFKSDPTAEAMTFVWETSLPPHLNRPTYHGAILTHARRAGVKTREISDGFVIER